VTPAEAAAELNGQEYNSRFHSENHLLFKEMAMEGLVAVYGESDDLMEFCGAINDEISAYNGTTAYLDGNGLIENECSNEECPHFAIRKMHAKSIEALWCDEENVSWTFRTDIPHETFEIMEDDEVFCRGIVFRLSDVG
jgi:hypothetical protein